MASESRPSLKDRTETKISRELEFERLLRIASAEQAARQKLALRKRDDTRRTRPQLMRQVD
jgi:hypothetical protein